MPEWKILIHEEPFSAGPQGAKGIGELPLDGGAPAIANFEAPGEEDLESIVMMAIEPVSEE